MLSESQYHEPGWAGVEVTTSFAGRTAAPMAAAGHARVGGFGGAAGLAAHLRDERVDVFLLRYLQGEQTLEPGAPCSGGVGA